MKTLRGLFIAVTVLSGVAVADSVTDLTGATSTFADCFTNICSGGIIDILPPSCDPAEVDVNGTSWYDLTTSPSTSHMQGNGMSDCYAELKLLEVVLKDPGFHVGTLTHQLAHDAYNANAMQFATDVGSYWPLFISMANGFQQLLKGYMTLGDGNATITHGDPLDPGKITRIDSSGSAGFVKAALAQMAGMVSVSEINLSNYHRLPQYFGTDGDADGDGASNGCEFEAYGPGAPGGSNALYVTNALNPAAHPAKSLCVSLPPNNTGDSDHDGLSDQDEITIGTDPNNPDTDGDGVNDGTEVKYHSDPLDPNSKVALPALGAAGLFALVACCITARGLLQRRRRN